MLSFYFASPIHKPRADRLMAEVGEEIGVELQKAGAPLHKVHDASLKLVARTIQYDLGLFEPPSFDVIGMRASSETMRHACGVIAQELTDTMLLAQLIVADPLVGQTLMQASKCQAALSSFAKTMTAPKGPPKKLAVQRYIAYEAIVWREATGKWPAKTSNDIDGVTSPLAILIANLTEAASARTKKVVPSLRQWRQGLELAKSWTKSVSP